MRVTHTMKEIIYFSILVYRGGQVDFVKKNKKITFLSQILVTLEQKGWRGDLEWKMMCRPSWDVSSCTLTSIKHICIFNPFGPGYVAGFLVTDIYGWPSVLSVKVVKMDCRQQMSKMVYLKRRGWVLVLTYAIHLLAAELKSSFLPGRTLSDRPFGFTHQTFNPKVKAHLVVCRCLWWFHSGLFSCYLNSH